MRILLALLALLLLVLAAALAAVFYWGEPVYVRYGEWSAAPPMWLAVGAFLLGGLLFLLGGRVLLALVFLPAVIARWRRERRATQVAELRRMTMKWAVYGNRRNMLKYLGQLAEEDEAACFRAAMVAEELGDARAQEKYLRRAAAAGDAVIAAAAKAKLCMRENRLTEASGVLVAAGAPREAALLAQLAYEAAMGRGDAPAALAAALALRDELPAVYAVRVDEAVAYGLERGADAAAVKSFWRETVPAGERKRPALLALWVEALWRCGDEKAAGEALAAAARQFPRDLAVLRAAIRMGGREVRETLFRANEKHAEGADDALFLQLMAELAESLELSGKARRYEQMRAALEARRAAA